MRRRLLITLALSNACALSGQAFAQESAYPSRAVRILVPFTAGTNADLVARLFAQKLSERLKQTFVVENKAGAGGVLAAQALLSSQPDGHTLMLVSSAHAANPSLNTQLPYDTLRDFTGIAMVGDSPTIIVAHPSLGVRTQAELAAAARKKAGDLNYSSPGIGSAAHFACEYFRAEAGIDMLHIPFKGTEYVAEVLSGRAQIACPPIGLAAPHIRDGKLVPISVTSRERVPSMPDVPTASESGLQGFDYGIWYGLVASSKTPESVTRRLMAEMSAIVSTKEVADAMTAQGITPLNVTGLKFDAFIKSEIEKLRRIAKASGVTRG